MKQRTQTRIKTNSETCMRQHLEKVSLQRYVTLSLLALFLLNSISALVMVFLLGCGKIILSEKVILTVIGQTISQAAGVFVIVTKYLFPYSKLGCDICGSRKTSRSKRIS